MRSGAVHCAVSASRLLKFAGDLRPVNLEFAPARQESDEWHGGMVAVEHTTARPTFRGQDVEPLHRADILMIEGVAMRDKAPGSGSAPRFGIMHRCASLKDAALLHREPNKRASEDAATGSLTPPANRGRWE